VVEKTKAAVGAAIAADPSSVSPGNTYRLVAPVTAGLQKECEAFGVKVESVSLEEGASTGGPGRDPHLA